MPGATITTAYAQGEAVPAVVLGVHDPDHPLRLGREAPGTTVKLVGLDRRPVADGALGEIVMHSAAPKRLYLDPERNRTTHVDGWTHTQDLGRREPDGTLTLFDRAVDVVHTAHGPVSSLAVEQVLYDHPGVREVAVVASGPEGAQDVVAFVVRRRGQAPIDELRALAANRLRPEERPMRWRFPRTLPRGVTGKVAKRTLRARARLDVTAAGPASGPSRTPSLLSLIHI